MDAACEFAQLSEIELTLKLAEHLVPAVVDVPAEQLQPHPEPEQPLQDRLDQTLALRPLAERPTLRLSLA